MTIEKMMERIKWYYDGLEVKLQRVRSKKWCGLHNCLWTMTIGGEWVGAGASYDTGKSAVEAFLREVESEIKDETVLVKEYLEIFGGYCF